MYPTQVQKTRLSDVLQIHQRLYNLALSERIRLYKEEKKSLSFAAQCKVLTQWRKEDVALTAINAQSLQVTLKRLDLAFQAFFRRVKSGLTPGFPRFKALQRFSGWGYKTHGDGFRLEAEKLRLSGIGIIKLRGKARNQGEVKTCEILYKAGKWYATFTIECEPKRSCGKRAIGIDWGVETFVSRGGR